MTVRVGCLQGVPASGISHYYRNQRMESSLEFTEEELGILDQAIIDGYLITSATLVNGRKRTAYCDKCHKKQFQGFETGARFVYMEHNKICPCQPCVDYHVCGVKTSNTATLLF